MPDGAIADPHELLRDMRRFMGRRNGESVLLGEVNLPPAQLLASSASAAASSSTCCSRSRSTRRCTSRSRARTPRRSPARCARCRRLPHDCQWAHFVRNHDELTLDKLSEAERDEVFAAFGPERGPAALRPRPAPPAAARCSAATSAGSGSSTRSCSRSRARRCCSTARRSGWRRTSRSRAATRCARRCSGRPSRTAGSRPPTSRGRPPLADGPFGYREVNVAAQRRDPGLAAELDRAADPPPARVPRAGLGRLVAAGAGRPGRARPSRRLGRLDDRRRAQPRGPGDRGASWTSTPTASLVDLFGPDEPALDGRAATAARAVRPPLVPAAAGRAARRPVGAIPIAGRS